MRKLLKGMENDLGFQVVYRSSNGSAIVEVTHEVSRDAGMKVHPKSYMAFVNLQALPMFWHNISTVGGVFTLNDSAKTGLARNLKGIWQGVQEYIDYFTTYMESTEPDMGFYHDTLWSAKVAVKACEDPFNLHLAVEQVAREERKAEGREMARNIRARHFDGLREAIDESKARGKLPVNTVTFVEEIGGGLQALAVHFTKGHTSDPNAGYENLYLWLTDESEIMVGIYDSSDQDDEGHVIIVQGANGFSNPQAVTSVVATLEALIKFGRLYGELY